MSRMLLLALAVVASSRAAPGKATFNASEISGPGAEIFFCDLDGDGLKDAVLPDGMFFSVIYQDAREGFLNGTGQKSYRFAEVETPVLVWPARLGGGAESVMVMTSDGVSELCLTNRNGPPVRRPVANQRTIIPEATDGPQVHFMNLTAATGSGRPLLLVPTVEGLQVWRQVEGWQQSQLLRGVVAAHLWPSVMNPGYTRAFGLSVAVEDVNGDRQEDLMSMRTLAGGLQVYELYLQQAGGQFASEPALSYTNRADSRSAHYWIDFNADGRLDLIRSTVSDEYSFLPGLRSGKTVVAVFEAGQRAQIPLEPQQVFRKHDWSAAVPIVDMDGDGLADLALGYMTLETREGMRRIITTEQAELSLSIHFYRKGAGFSKRADCIADVPIYFGREFFSSFDRRLEPGQFINLTGDVDGDGSKDLLFRDGRDSLRAWCFVSAAKGFASRAALRFVCPEPIDWWEVREVNGDGVSDVIVKVRKPGVFRAFTSQRL